MENKEGDAVARISATSDPVVKQDVSAIAESDNNTSAPESEVSTTQGKNKSESKTQSKKDNLTNIDKLALSIADALSETMRYGDRGDAKAQLLNLIRTFANVAIQPEGIRGVRLDDTYYSFEEYQMPKNLAAAMPPARIQVIDQDYAINFANNDGWRMTLGKVLNPSELAVCIKNLGRCFRMTIETQALTRQEVGTLASWAEYAVVGGKVSSRKANKLCFLTTKFLMDQFVPLEILGTYIGFGWLGIEIS